MIRTASLFIWFAFVGASTADAAVITIEGTINEIDAKTRTITVETSGGAKSLDVSSKAKVSIEGKDSALDSLKAGQRVKLSYHDELEVVLKIELVLASPNDNAATQRDLALLKGEWLTIGEETNGNQRSRDELKTINRRLQFDGNGLTVQRVVGGKLGAYEGTVQINPDATPKEFDFAGTDPAGNPVQWRGIYEVTEDSLRMTYRYVVRPETQRPKEFKTMPASRQGEAFVGVTCKRDPDDAGQPTVEPAWLIGEFDITWKEEPRGKTGSLVYSFSAKHEVRRGGELMGKWEPKGDTFRVEFANSDRGYVLITPVGNDRLKGEHFWPDGRRGTWTGKRRNN